MSYVYKQGRILSINSLLEGEHSGRIVQLDDFVKIIGIDNASDDKLKLALSFAGSDEGIKVVFPDGKDEKEYKNYLFETLEKNGIKGDNALFVALYISKQYPKVIDIKPGLDEYKLPKFKKCEKSSLLFEFYTADNIKAMFRNGDIFKIKNEENLEFASRYNELNRIFNEYKTFDNEFAEKYAAPVEYKYTNGEVNKTLDAKKLNEIRIRMKDFIDMYECLYADKLKEDKYKNINEELTCFRNAIDEATEVTVLGKIWEVMSSLLVMPIAFLLQFTDYFKGVYERCKISVVNPTVGRKITNLRNVYKKIERRVPKLSQELDPIMKK